MRIRIALLFAVVTVTAVAQKAPSKAPQLLPWSQQIAVREQWLVKRHEMILPMMRKFGINMWIVVNEEFHDDPLTQYIAPPRPYAGGRESSSSSTPATRVSGKLRSAGIPKKT